MVRIYTPEDGWGRVVYLIHNTLHALYPDDPSEPDVYAWVLWDAGGGRYVNPARSDAVIQGAVELSAMAIELPAMPPYLPLGI